MNYPLPKKDLERLAAICGLFSSDHAGERASAAQKADELIRKQGLRWPDVLIPAALPAPSDSSIEQKICTILANLGALNAWERGFIHDVNGRRVFSEKQHAVIERLFRKTTAHYAARRRA